MKNLIKLPLILLFFFALTKSLYAYCDSPSCMDMSIMMPDGAGEWVSPTQALKTQSSPLATTTFTPVPTISPVATSTPVPEQSPALGVAKNVMEYARDGLGEAWQWLSDGIGKLKDKAADTLIKGLTSNIPGVAQASEWALVGMGELAVEPLIKASTNSKISSVGDIIRVVVNIGKPAVKPLIEILDKNADMKMRVNASTALSMMNDPRIVNPLIKALREDSDARVRGNAAAGLASMRDPAAFEALAEALENDPEPSVRNNSAIGLGRIGDLRAMELLKRAASRDADPKVQQAARQALAILEKRYNRTF